jgi:hypothetical protein
MVADPGIFRRRVTASPHRRRGIAASNRTRPGGTDFFPGNAETNAAVTMHCHGCPMRPEPERCGVCIVRVVRQASGLRITLTMRSDVEDASTETQHKTTDVAQAVEAVRNFILGLNHRSGDLAGDGGVTAFRQTRRVAGFGSIAAVGKSLEMVLNAGFSAVPPIDNENSRAQLIRRPGFLRSRPRSAVAVSRARRPGLLPQWRKPVPSMIRTCSSS